MKKTLKTGVTLLELVVVLVIISILSTVAVGVYTKEVLRAKVARTRAEIRTLEVAINRYQIDTGQFPPSSTGTNLPPNPLDPLVPFQGAGYMQVAIRSSLSANQNFPLSRTWAGPYIEWDDNRLGTLAGGPVTTAGSPPQVQFIDPFFNPYYYVQFREYDTIGATMLPVTHPYFATETYYNPATFQIISFGPNRVSNFAPNQLGTDEDDLTNWVSSAN